MFNYADAETLTDRHSSLGSRTFADPYGGRESSARCNFRKHMQIKETTSSIWQHSCCKCSQHNQKKRNALQIEKNTCKLRKRFRQFDNAHAANAHNTTKKETCCKINIFDCVVSICSVFLYLFVLRTFVPSAVKMMKIFSWFAGDFSICMYFLKLHIRKCLQSAPPGSSRRNWKQISVLSDNSLNELCLFFSLWKEFIVLLDTPLSCICIVHLERITKNLRVVFCHCHGIKYFAYSTYFWRNKWVGERLTFPKINK